VIFLEIGDEAVHLGSDRAFYLRGGGKLGELYFFFGGGGASYSEEEALVFGGISLSVGALLSDRF
jgi:hypothetical protein